jgi:hypothetical protein
MRPLKKLPTATDTPAEPIDVGITVMAIGLITAMATEPTRIMATATGHTVITATAGDQASPSESDEAGAGATKSSQKEALGEIYSAEGFFEVWRLAGLTPAV